MQLNQYQHDTWKVFCPFSQSYFLRRMIIICIKCKLTNRHSSSAEMFRKPPKRVGFNLNVVAIFVTVVKWTLLAWIKIMEKQMDK